MGLCKILVLISLQITNIAAFAPISSTRIFTTTILGPTAANGLTYNDVVVGDGKEVSKGDSISIHYVGSFSNGGETVEFENSRSASVNRGVVGATEGMPIVFFVGKGKVIPGWEEGILGNGNEIPAMKVGGKRTLEIPADLAYGSEGRGVIPANQDLVFDIELMDIGVQTESIISQAFRLAVPGVFGFLILNSIYLYVTGQA